MKHFKARKKPDSLLKLLLYKKNDDVKCFDVFPMSFCIWTDVRIFAEDKSQTFEHDFGPDSEP